MNNTNLILSIILSIAIIIGWQFLYERPKLNNLASRQVENNISPAQTQEPKQVEFLTIEQSLEQSDRVAIENSNIIGSINLRGARFDDITLRKYKNQINQPQTVRLLSPSKTAESYFAQVGWYGSGIDTDLPNDQTVWKASSNFLTKDTSVTLNWINNDSVEFIIKISIDDQYMVFVDQQIKNNSSKIINFKTYGLINKVYDNDKNDTILHKGPIAVINDELKEVSYTKLKDERKKIFRNVKSNWVGITDKYWLTAFIPDQQYDTAVNFNYSAANNAQKFQIDVLSNEMTVESGQTITTSSKLFIGAKEVKLLDQYSQKHGIKLLDRAIDFGWLYVITKPLFYGLSFFDRIFGNFGLSIMFMTVLIKICMFSLSTKSGKSMKKLKELQPRIEEIKQKCADNKVMLNQEMLALYKRENINPLSGCLPILIQIPVFFAIYKVLYVTIEMRHAPFYGWISDLSAADPASILTLFGLIPITLPSFLQIGIWPALMSISMFLQQQVSGNAVADPVQAQVMKLLPLIFLFTFASFPAGLLIYWTWSNFLSIMQQLYINKYIN